VLAIRAELRRHSHSTRVGSVTTTSVSYTCELVGMDAARQLLEAFTWRAMQAFGQMPSNGELLEWFVARELGGDASGSPSVPAS
jgi:hypothetical protein